MTEQTATPPPSKPLATAGAILGIVIGIAASKYCGPAAWLPFIVGVVLVLLFTKTPVGPKHFVLAIGAALTHVIWFAVGAIILGDWSNVALDIALLFVGVVWLWVKPGVVGAIYLGLLQLAFLGINLYMLSQHAFGDEGHRMQTAHAILRIIGLIGVVSGYKLFAQGRSAKSISDA